MSFKYQVLPNTIRKTMKMATMRKEIRSRQ